MAISIGTAGWSIPRDIGHQFPEEGSGLARYASRFHIAEINSSFHRPHRISTWARWRDSVPDDFRFSVKLPKQITHVRKLVDCGEELNQFMGEAQTLAPKLAVLLVQLPPKLAFFLREFAIARVAADPAICDAAARPSAWGDLSYWRLHGSPVVYRSSYADRIDHYAAQLAQESAIGKDVWCIFDNTASSAGAADALLLIEALRSDQRPKASHRSEIGQVGTAPKRSG
jgi:uncharacterized protein YecE (DUF72 family)